MLKIHFLNLVIFAGLISLSNAQSFDARWVEVPNSTFTPKQVPAVVYDAQADRIVMFSGGYFINEAVFLSNELLSFSSINGWSAIIPYYSLPANCLWDVNCCYDEANSRIIFAGGTFPNSDDTWALTANQFSHLCDSEIVKGNSGRGLFFNSQINRVCLVGWDGQIYKLEGTLWQSMSVNLPNWYDRHVFGYSYNPVSKKLVIFGGSAVDPEGKDIMYSDTFVWNAQTMIWKEIVKPIHPGERSHPAMTFSSTRQKHIMFGGGTFSDNGGVRTWQMNSDVWEYDDTSEQWTELRIENPHGQDMHRLIYDKNHDKVYAIGGSDDAHGWAPSTRIFDLQFIPQSAAKAWEMYNEKKGSLVQ